MSIAQIYDAKYIAEKVITKSDFTRYFLYKKGKVVLNSVSKEDIDHYCVANNVTKKDFVVEQDFDEEAYKSAQNERNARLNQIHYGFRDALFREYNVSGDRAIHLFQVCESQSSSLEEIENLFDSFVVFIYKQ